MTCDWRCVRGRGYAKLRLSGAESAPLRPFRRDASRVNLRSTIIGRPGSATPEPPADDLAEIRSLRVRAAREQTQWREIAEPVVRGRWFVDAETDRLYRVYRGATFVGSKLEFAYDRDKLVFFVNRDGGVVVLEPVSWPATWSEHVERQARREASTR